MLEDTPFSHISQVNPGTRKYFTIHQNLRAHFPLSMGAYRSRCHIRLTHRASSAQTDRQTIQRRPLVKGLSVFNDHPVMCRYQQQHRHIFASTMRRRRRTPQPAVANQDSDMCRVSGRVCRLISFSLVPCQSAASWQRRHLILFGNRV